MHYRNGREANNGDRVVQLDFGGGKIVASGILHNATPGNDYCNGVIVFGLFSTGACLCDCLHIEDIEAMIAEKGLDKRPKGK